MKKLLLSLMLISPLTFADGYIASYSIQVSDVQKFAGSFDKLMKSMQKLALSVERRIK